MDPVAIVIGRFFRYGLSIFSIFDQLIKSISNQEMALPRRGDPKYWDICILTKKTIVMTRLTNLFPKHREKYSLECWPLVKKSLVDRVSPCFFSILSIFLEVVVD